VRGLRPASGDDRGSRRRKGPSFGQAGRLRALAVAPAYTRRYTRRTMSDESLLFDVARDPVEVLRSVFGYDAFRGEQEAIVEHVVGGGDALVLMPTGAGKSLCYQIPALVRDGTGVVVSPLIALMQDQVDALRELGVRAALDRKSTRLNSSHVKISYAVFCLN